jgi:integrase
MDLELVRRILDTQEAVMPNQRYQDPKVLTRKDVPRPFFYILVSCPVLTDTGELTHKRKPMRLGYCDETTMREAKEAKKVILAEANNGRGLLQAQIPFGKVLDKYIEVRLPQIPACQDSYENKIAKHIRPAFGKLRMCDIERVTVEEFFNQKEAAGYSHNTLLDLRKVISAVFEKAREWKFWDGNNPCAKLKVGGVRQVFSKKLPKDVGIGQFIDAIEPTRIIDAAGARLIALVSVSAGLRESEVLGLQVKDVDAEAETITVQRNVTRRGVGPTKTPDSERTRQLPELAAVLLEYAAGKQPEDFIFTRPTGENLDDRDLQQHVFRPALERAGIYVPGLGIRRFRHVNITWRQQAGAEPFEAMRAAGHTQPSTTWIYTHNEDDRDRAHVKAILDRLRGGDKRLFLIKKEAAS